MIIMSEYQYSDIIFEIKGKIGVIKVCTSDAQIYCSRHQSSIGQKVSTHLADVSSSILSTRFASSTTIPKQSLLSSQALADSSRLEQM
jgi:hypothetical protein